MNMSRLTFVQALIFTLFLVMAISGLWLGYIWQDGMLGPEETQERLDETSKVFGPWAILIDIFIFMPLTWWFTRKYVWREKSLEFSPDFCWIKPLLYCLQPLPSHQHDHNSLNLNMPHLMMTGCGMNCK